MTSLDLKDAYLSVPVHKDSQKLLHFFWRDKFCPFQGLCFGLIPLQGFFTKLLKPVAAHLRKRGVLMILDLDVFLPSERHSYRYSSLGKPRFDSKSGKVVSNPNTTNNISGFCNRLLRRKVEASGRESGKSEVYLQESNHKSNYACTPGSKPTGHPRVLSPGHLASTPSFQVLTDPINPYLSCDRAEL